MHHMKQPGALSRNRVGEIVLGGTLPHTIGKTDLQGNRLSSCRVIGWRVTRWLGVETVEVQHAE